MSYANLIKHTAELYPNSEVKPDANAFGLYQAMFEHAKKNSKEGCFCFNPEQSIDFCKEYLGITDKEQTALLGVTTSRLNLEDFF